jgi:TolB-like protein/tetratricopeptide (TPR) repeat protein
MIPWNMSRPYTPARVFRFGPYEVDARTRELRKTGLRIQLQEKSFQVLDALLEHPGELVSREHLRRRLWGEGVCVDFENGLNSAVNRLRDALRDRVRRPKYIETLPRLGYRFIAPVLRVRAFEQPTVAVLPLENLSSDPEQAYFADGLTDLLITELAHISGLRVISRQSVLQFKGTAGKVAEVGRKLNVDAIVEGTAFHAGDQVRITTQLVQVEPEQHLWAGTHDGEIGDVLAMQARVAKSVAEAVAVALLPGEEARLERLPQIPPEAQLAYMKARYHGSHWTREGLEKAFAHLQQALALDANYAAAHAELANSLSLLAYWGHLPIRPTYQQARQLAARAVELDDGLCLAHHALAWTLWLNDWDVAGCDREIRRAIDLSPSDAGAHMLHAIFLVTMRRDSEGALAEARYGLDLDPLSEFTNSGGAWIALFARRHKQAVYEATRTLEMFPYSVQAYYVLGLANSCLGKLSDAIVALERAISISRDPIGMGYLGHVYALAGRAEEARELLEELKGAEYVPAKSLISIYAGLGDLDMAFEALERAWAERDPVLFWLHCASPFEPLRDDPRFEDLQSRLPSCAVAR